MGRQNNNPWYSNPNEFLQCPVPDCGHTGTIITKIHCRMAHDLTREQVGQSFGFPKVVGKARFVEYE